MKLDKINSIRQAIINNDILYLQTHITAKNKIDFSELTDEDKINFFILLKKNMQKFGLAKEVIDLSKDLLFTIDTKNVRMCQAIDDFCRGLGRQCNDFSRIVYLKGKIDYLKNKANEAQEKKALCVVKDLE